MKIKTQYSTFWGISTRKSKWNNTLIIHYIKTTCESHHAFIKCRYPKMQQKCKGRKRLFPFIQFIACSDSKTIFSQTNKPSLSTTGMFMARHNKIVSTAKIFWTDGVLLLIYMMTAFVRYYSISFYLCATLLMPCHKKPKKIGEGLVSPPSKILLQPTLTLSAKDLQPVPAGK